SPETGDGARDVTFHDNYFADTRSLGGYLNGNSVAPSSFTFRANYFGGHFFSYTTVDADAKDPGVVFGINGANTAPIVFDANTLDEKALLSGIDLNGTKGNVTATNNTRGSFTPVSFVASGYPDVPTAKLSAWGATATLAAGKPPIAYVTGDL